MNAISDVESLKRPSCEQHLHLAAVALAYFVGDGSIAFSEAAAALARAAIRQGHLDAGMSATGFHRLLARLERTLSTTVLDIEHEAADAVRAIVSLCMDRGATDVMIREAALAVNDEHGRVLPVKCVDWIVRSEVNVDVNPTLSKQSA